MGAGIRTCRRSTLFALAAIATVATACAGSGSKPASSAPTTAAHTSTAVKLGSGGTYAAVGSSYAAGPGIPSQLPGTCARSDHNYPHLVAAALHLDLTDVSCSGATTANAVDTPQGTNPPQLDAVTARTTLVTMTIGGNDVGYIATALACGQPHGSGCSADPATLDREFTELHGSLTSLIADVRAKAPSATIVLVTYPRLVPTNACPALSYTPAGTALVGSMGQRLQQVFIAVAKETGVRLADPYAVGDGHGPCAPASARWIDGKVAPGAFPYHPTALGHLEMARLVEHALGH